MDKTARRVRQTLATVKWVWTLIIMHS